MDGAGNGGVMEPSTPQSELVQALNEQVMPQLAMLSHGPLQVGALQALEAAIDQSRSITGTLLHVRVKVGDRLLALAVQIVVSP